MQSISPLSASYKLQSFQQTAAISVFDGDVVKSDTAIPSALKDTLSTGIAKLEDSIPHSHRDWHPRFNEKFLHLVHPSLFPVIYGRTKILPGNLAGLDDCIARCGKGWCLRSRPRRLRLVCAAFLPPRVTGYKRSAAGPIQSKVPVAAL